MEDFKPENATEALADAWASIDGNKVAFRAGKGKPIDEQPEGRYCGYMADAEAMINRLKKRGFDVWEIIDGPAF